MSLYTDDNPETTITGTGFKNAKKVKDTFNLIKKRSMLYQFQVVNTMYYRAKHHKYKTDDMKEAMILLKKWLDNYEKEKNYEYLPLHLVNRYEKLADEYNISRVARGLDKPTKSDEGFLVVYRKVNGNGNKLVNKLVKKNKPQSADWNIHRNNFIKSRLGQMKKANIKWFYNTGVYKNLPTKQHLVLIMNAFSPYKKRLHEIIKEHDFFI